MPLSAAVKRTAAGPTDYSKPPWGLRWRSHTIFILFTVGTSIFTDLFLYGIIVPILPFLLLDRAALPPAALQSTVSGLLSAYAIASFVFSPLAGIIADRTSSRQLPFLCGLIALTLATVGLFAGTTVWVLVLARVAQGASGAVVWVVGLALCVDTVGSAHLGKAFGTIFSVCSAGTLFAPPLGGLLYRQSGVGSVAALCLAMLAVDFAMRLLMVEKKVASGYADAAAVVVEEDEEEAVDGAAEASDDHVQSSAHAQTETTPLLPKTVPEDEATDSADAAADQDADPDAVLYYIPPLDTLPRLVREFPILYCFTSPEVLVALTTALVHALMLGTFDATVPIRAYELFRFDSLQAGILFVPLGVTDFIVGPIAGWAVDRYGTKPVGTVGYAILAPMLVLLRLPHAAAPGSEAEQRQIGLIATLLALCGIGSSILGAPGMVALSTAVEKFHRRNPGVFGDIVPYAQVYGVYSMMFCAGLSVGPLFAGWLKDAFGYGNMNAVMGACAAVTSVLCFAYMGGRPTWPTRKLI